MPRPTVKMMALEHFDSALGLPRYETPGAAGADLKACLGEGKTLTLAPGTRALVPTGLAMAVASGFEIQIRPRSGLSLKTGLVIPNSPGTVDSDYRGEVKVIMANLGEDEYVISHGDRIAQMVIAPVFQSEFITVDSLDNTLRGKGGFGSTGQSLGQNPVH